DCLSAAPAEPLMMVPVQWAWPPWGPPPRPTSSAWSVPPGLRHCTDPVSSETNTSPGAKVAGGGGGGAWETVTVTGSEVVMLPASSRATAVRVCGPSLVVLGSQETAYGDVVSSPPRLPPSSLNCTPLTIRLQIMVTLAVTGVVPPTVDPDLGEVRVTTRLPGSGSGNGSCARL